MTAPSCEERTDEQLAADKRLQEQCFLIDYMDVFGPMGQGIPYASFMKAQGGAPVDFISKLVTPKGLAPLMEMKPHELSSLVPYIKLYKVFYPSESSEGIEYEMKFNSFLQDADVQSMMTTRKGRGAGCGIKSFEWKLAGGNPVEADKMIEAKLVLYFQSMDDLFQKQRLEPYHLGEEADGGEPRELAFVDLIHQTNKMTGEPCGPSDTYNNKYFRIKATVGWSNPQQRGRAEGAAPIMGQAGCTVFLTMVKHDIGIGANGDVTLTIDYMAAPEGALSDPSADILMADRTAIATLQGELDHEKQTVERAQPRTRCGSEEDREAAEDEVESANERVAEAEVVMRAEKGKLYKNFLTEVEKRGAMFYADIPDDAMGSYEAAWMFGLVGGDQLCNEDAANQRGALNRERPSPGDWVNSITRSPGGQFDSTNDAIDTNSEADPDERTDPDDNGQADMNEEESKHTGVIGGAANSVFNWAFDTNLPTEGNSTRIHYIYLGALLDTAIGTIVSDEDSRLKEIRTLIGPFEYMDPLDYTKKSICLADIPIALNLFKVWFFDNCVQPQRERWVLKDFLQTIISTLLAPAMGQDCFGVCASGYRTRANMRIIEIPLDDEKKCRISEKSTVADFGGGKTRNLATLMTKPYPSGDNAEGLKSGSYFFMYATGSTTSKPPPPDGESRVDRDAAEGVYHFVMGADRGLVKQINFKREDAPHMTAARIQADGPGNLALRALYNADVDLFGNSIWVPGSMVFIDTGGFSTGGNAGDAGSSANILGIGGYYLITNVDNFIEAGKFETKLTCVWQSLGTGKKPDTDMYCKPITECGGTEDCDEEEETPTTLPTGPT